MSRERIGCWKGGMVDEVDVEVGEEGGVMAVAA
jgi:hypothetical protein